jgi:hypothetical protein
MFEFAIDFEKLARLAPEPQDDVGSGEGEPRPRPVSASRLAASGRSGSGGSRRGAFSLLGLVSGALFELYEGAADCVEARGAGNGSSSMNRRKASIVAASSASLSSIAGMD